MIERVLRNTAATVTVTFYNGTTAVDADGAVTVTATKADGTNLFTTPATDEAGTGVYSILIPPQTLLNNLALVWSGTFTGTPISIESTVEIVGGFFFSLSELRASDSALTPARFSNSALSDARLSVESEFEDICERAFVPRFYAEYVNGDCTDDGLWLTMAEPLSVTALTQGGTVYDAAAWEAAGYIRRDKDALHRLILKGPALALAYLDDVYVEYEYGMPQVPIPIKEKAIRRAKLNLLGMASTIDPRATTMMLPDIGTVNLATPGMRGLEIGIPDIDVVLRRYQIGSSGGVF